jgi:hypothetical protein
MSASSKRFSAPLEHVVVLACYLVSTLLMTLPVALSLGSAIPIDHQIKDWYPGDGDPWHYLWGFWYFTRAFTTFPPHPFWTDLVFYPIGFQIPFLTGVGAILLPAALLAPVLGLTLTYNVLWLLSFVLAGYTMYLLARELFHDRLVAFFCGHLFMFSSYRMIHAREHLPLLLASFLVPVFVLSLSRAIARPTTGRCAVPALVLAISAGISWYCTIALAIYLAVFVVVVLRDRRLRASSRPPARAVAVAVVVVAVAAAPFVLPMAVSPVRDNILIRTLRESTWFSADLLAFFVPSPANPVFGKLTAAIYEHFTGNPYEQTVYLGYVLLGLALWGVLRASRGQTRLFVAVAATFFVLALGPFLHVDGRYQFPVDGETVSVPLPYLLLRYVPFVNGMRVPSRFTEVLVVALTILAGYGLVAIRARVANPRWRAALVGLMLVASAVELAAAPFPVLSTRVPQIYSDIRAIRGSFMVLELPLDWHIIKYHYYQTVHGKRLLVGHPVRSRDKYSEYPLGVPLVPLLREPRRLLEPRSSVDDRRDAERLVQFFDIRYIVIHRAYLNGPVFEALDRFIAASFPHDGRWTDGDVVAYSVKRAAVAGALWPEDYTIDFGAPARQFAVLTGWAMDEREGDMTFQWSNDDESSMYLYLQEPLGRVLEARLRPLTYDGAPRQTVSVYVNGAFRDRLTLDPGWAQYRLDIPAGALRPGVNEITFKYGYAVQPAKVLAGNPDTRRLAVAFDYVALRRAR